MLGDITLGNMVHTGQRQQAGMNLGGRGLGLGVPDLGVQRTMLHRTGLGLRNDRSPRSGPITTIGSDRENIRQRQDAVHVIMSRLSDLGRLGRRDDGLVNSQEKLLRYAKTHRDGWVSQNF